jgi:hypothetical protein
MMPASERTKTVHALDRSATVTGLYLNLREQIKYLTRMIIKSEKKQVVCNEEHVLSKENEDLMSALTFRFKVLTY